MPLSFPLTFPSSPATHTVNETLTRQLSLPSPGSPAKPLQRFLSFKSLAALECGLPKCIPEEKENENEANGAQDKEEEVDRASRRMVQEDAQSVRELLVMGFVALAFATTTVWVSAARGTDGEVSSNDLATGRGGVKRKRKAKDHSSEASNTKKRLKGSQSSSNHKEQQHQHLRTERLDKSDVTPPKERIVSSPQPNLDTCIQTLHSAFASLNDSVAWFTTKHPIPSSSPPIHMEEDQEDGLHDNEDFSDAESTCSNPFLTSSPAPKKTSKSTSSELSNPFASSSPPPPQPIHPPPLENALPTATQNLITESHSSLKSLHSSLLQTTALTLPPYHPSPPSPSAHSETTTNNHLNGCVALETPPDLERLGDAACTAVRAAETALREYTTETHHDQVRSSDYEVARSAHQSRQTTQIRTSVSWAEMNEEWFGITQDNDDDRDDDLDEVSASTSTTSSSKRTAQPNFNAGSVTVKSDGHHESLQRALSSLSSLHASLLRQVLKARESAIPDDKDSYDRVWPPATAAAATAGSVKPLRRKAPAVKFTRSTTAAKLTKLKTARIPLTKLSKSKPYPRPRLHRNVLNARASSSASTSFPTHKPRPRPDTTENSISTLNPISTLNSTSTHTSSQIPAPHPSHHPTTTTYKPDIPSPLSPIAHLALTAAHESFHALFRRRKPSEPALTPTLEAAHTTARPSNSNNSNKSNNSNLDPHPHASSIHDQEPYSGGRGGRTGTNDNHDDLKSNPFDLSTGTRSHYPGVHASQVGVGVGGGGGGGVGVGASDQSTHPDPHTESISPTGTQTAIDRLLASVSAFQSYLRVMGYQ